MIIFVLVRLSPTDPVAVILGGKQSSAETVANIRQEFHLDRSPVEQYGIWASGMLRGDFGTSYQYRQPVSDMIAQRMPVTLGIVILAMVIGVAVSIPLGIFSAVKRHKWQEGILSIVFLILVACPPFLTSILMIWFLSVHAPGFSFVGSATTFGEFLQRISLPALALSFSLIAFFSRVMKAGMTEELQSDYFMAARARGMGRNAIIWKHCFRNAIIPVVTITGLEVGILLVGSVLVETVFSLQGIGSILISAVQGSDYPVVQGITMLIVFIFLTISTILDIVYGLIDPRVRAL
ncbi:MAG: ABC transporter permease [Clostridiales bacterium]|nr:ABC transporter permease [Clostridiales bacterium]